MNRCQSDQAGAFEQPSDEGLRSQVAGLPVKADGRVVPAERDQIALFRALLDA